MQATKLKHFLQQKKGIAVYDAVMWIVRALFLVFVVLTFVFLVSAFFVTEIDTQLAESLNFINRAYYSSSALAISDLDTGRTYVGAADFQKPNPLSSSVDYKTQKFIAARISDGSNEWLYNGQQFNDWNVLAKAGLTVGPGGVRKIYVSKIMLVRDASGTSSKGVQFEVITPNS